MSDYFRNPYHFVPLASGDPPNRIPIADLSAPWPGLGSASANITHDRYVPGTHSGRITCRATVETPLICGNEQEERKGWTKLIHPFEIESGKPALPASGLRGMLSALAEAVTHSTLRVLKGGNARKFFVAISPDLEPMHDGRTKITLAEQLFGTVAVEDEIHKRRNRDSDATFALAGRVRVSHGLLAFAPDVGAYQNYTELLSPEQRNAIQGHIQDIPLHNLASPKPTAPALYFKPKNASGGYIPKDQLCPKLHRPLGRKFYLRRKDAGQVRSSQLFVHPARLHSKKDLEAIQKQHQSVHQFVRPRTQFEFHLDFDNLSDLELQLLIYVLAPTPAFRHQIGHGKPLGLGQMQFHILGVDLVDRQKRYMTDDLAAERSRSALDQVLPLQQAFRAWAVKHQLHEVLVALELLGAPPADDIPVHYPQADKKKVGSKENSHWVEIQRGTPDFETEQFLWFVQNDRLPSAQQYLESLLGQTRLPTLRRESRRGPDQAPPMVLAKTDPECPEDLKGGVYPFRVSKLNRDNDKLSFECAVPDFTHLSGSVDSNERKVIFLALPDLKAGDTLDLYVRNYTSASFQLALPKS